MRIYKNPAMKERAGELRGHMTPQETLLWNYCLKRLPVQIYRQYVIESYIVDFFCRKAKLVIEVDGRKVYHAGDTGLTMEMKLLEAEKIDVACLPIGGYFTMDYEDAARAARRGVSRFWSLFQFR